MWGDRYLDYVLELRFFVFNNIPEDGTLLIPNMKCVLCSVLLYFN